MNKTMLRGVLELILPRFVRKLLLDAGFTDAQIIQGGMTAWIAKEWPVETILNQKSQS